LSISPSSGSPPPGLSCPMPMKSEVSPSTFAALHDHTEAPAHVDEQHTPGRRQRSDPKEQLDRRAWRVERRREWKAHVRLRSDGETRRLSFSPLDEGEILGNERDLPRRIVRRCPVPPEAPHQIARRRAERLARDSCIHDRARGGRTGVGAGRDAPARVGDGRRTRIDGAPDDIETAAREQAERKELEAHDPASYLNRSVRTRSRGEPPSARRHGGPLSRCRLAR
jgi:hypothetical protein